VQRGVTVDEVISTFTKSVKLCCETGEVFVEGNYALVGRTRRGITTVRIDIERVTDVEGAANVVTIYLGRPGEDDNGSTIELV